MQCRGPRLRSSAYGLALVVPTRSDNGNGERRMAALRSMPVCGMRKAAAHIWPMKSAFAENLRWYKRRSTVNNEKKVWSRFEKRADHTYFLKVPPREQTPPSYTRGTRLHRELCNHLPRNQDHRFNNTS